MSAARIISLPVGFLSRLALLPTQFVLKLSVDSTLPSSIAKSPVSIPALCSAPPKHVAGGGMGQEADAHLQMHRRSSFLLQPQCFLLCLLWMDALFFPGCCCAWRQLVPLFQCLLWPPCSPGALRWACGENNNSSGAGVQEAPVASGLTVCGLAVLLLLVLPGPERSRARGSR